MSDSQIDGVKVLKLLLHGSSVGYLAGFNNGRNVLSFVDEFKADPNRPTFSLITHPDFTHSTRLMAEPWGRNQRLHPTLSNLLPEGGLAKLIAKELNVDPEDEFQILSYLGHDLPGALVVEPLEPDEIPENLLDGYGKVKALKIVQQTQEDKFSLAGVQMKFSMKEKNGRFHLAKDDELGDWIIKTPSTKNKDVPANEYTAMTLAELVGIDIPQIKLVELDKLDALPQIDLPDENQAFAIKRFDRDNNARIHTEDFAQVFVKLPHEKYNSANYEHIGKALYQFAGDGLADTQQFARRLLVNIILANGNAHLKNWSLLYTDQITPRLSLAYDIVTTKVYIEGERHSALNLGQSRDWYEATYNTFEAWADRAGIPWRAIKPHLDDTMEKARSLWPEAIKDLPMNGAHKFKLKKHWRRLQTDFRI